jgi:hypothetical protein
MINATEYIPTTKDGHKSGLFFRCCSDLHVALVKVKCTEATAKKYGSFKTNFVRETFEVISKLKNTLFKSLKEVD